MKNAKTLLLLGTALLLASCNQDPLPDAQAPTIALEATPSTLTGSATVTLRATASDDRGVTRVSFYRGDTLLSTDQAAPFETTDTVPVQAAGQVGYRAVAEDAAGNKAEAKRDVTLSLTEIAATVQEARPQTNANGALVLTLTGWTGGSGTVTVTLSGVQEGGTTGTTSLAADGSFRLSLPVPRADELQPFNSFSCQGNVTVSPSQARGAYGFVSVYANKTGVIRPLRLVEASAAGVTVQTGALIYADRAVTLNGTNTCSFFGESFDRLTLQAGWNKVHVTERYGENGSRVATFSNAPFLDNWVYLNDATGASSPSDQRAPSAIRSLFR